MPKYKALALLTSISQNRSIQAGEVFDLDHPETEKILLEAGWIVPAQTLPEAQPESEAQSTHRKKKEKELEE